MMYNPYTIGIPPQMPSNPQFNQMGYNYQPQQMQAVQPNPTASINVQEVITPPSEMGAGFFCPHNHKLDYFFRKLLTSLQFCVII